MLPLIYLFTVFIAFSIHHLLISFIFLCNHLCLPHLLPYQPEHMLPSAHICSLHTFHLLAADRNIFRANLNRSLCCSCEVVHSSPSRLWHNLNNRSAVTVSINQLEKQDCIRPASPRNSSQPIYGVQAADCRLQKCGVRYYYSSSCSLSPHQPHPSFPSSA